MQVNVAASLVRALKPVITIFLGWFGTAALSAVVNLGFSLVSLPPEVARESINLLPSSGRLGQFLVLPVEVLVQGFMFAAHGQVIPAVVAGCVLLLPGVIVCLTINLVSP